MSLNGLLLSCTQMNNQIWMKFYHAESNRIIIVKDTHRPYCFVSPTTAEKISEFPGLEITKSTKFDIVKDKMMFLHKVSTNNVNLIYSKDDQNALCNMYQTWESDMKLYESYLYDKGLIVGKWYDIHTLKPVDYLSNITGLKVNTEGIIDKEKFQRQVAKWASLLDEPIPKIRRLAFDIEVETGGSMPDPSTAEERVTAISFHSEDLRQVFVLKRNNIQIGKSEEELQDEMIKAGGIPYEGFSKPEYVIIWFDSEKEMLEKAFEIIESYPVVLTYNGDMFDMPYLYNRAVNLGISHIPFHTMGKNATLNLGIHIDMYGVFKNRSLKIYAFKSKYVEDGLDSVSKAMLGEGKIEYDGELTEIPLYLLAKYCYNDSRLTYKLSSFNNDLVMNLLIILSRISNLPIDDVSRLAISNWIKSLLYFTHRQNGELIPRSDDFPKVEASTESSTDKKYEGAIVLEPQPGIHFNVKVLDFASLYPSIIKTKNISYETVCCSHLECRKNMIPQTKHWACTKKTGIISMLIGTLKELRVGHFKQLSKNSTDVLKKQQYETISEALKVFLNASYGVIGFSSFPLYFLPTAEAVTAYGREIISQTVKTAREMGMNIIAGDTDSLFVKTPTVEQIKEIISLTNKKYHIDLEQDKEYRYVVFSNRKKNYFGIKTDGTADIKGLSGKKSSTPPFIRELFNNIMNDLKSIKTIEDFVTVKDLIRLMIKARVDHFDVIPLEQLSFKVLITKEPSEYKVKPPALKAAEQLPNKPKKGEFIQYVKIWKEPGVMPISMVDRKYIDKSKYIESLTTTLEQITDPMQIDINSIITGSRSTKMEEWF